MGTPLLGTVIASQITTGNTDNTFSIGDTNLMQGGHHQVADLTARDAITAARRHEGMFCWVVSENKMYQLVGGTDNMYWSEFSSGGGGGSTSPSGVSTNIQFNSSGSFAGDNDLIFNWTTKTAVIKNIEVPSSGVLDSAYIDSSLGFRGDDPAYITRVSAGNQSVDIDYTLPESQGVGALTNDGAGSLSWVQSSGVTPDVADATYIRLDGTNTPMTGTLDIDTNSIQFSETTTPGTPGANQIKLFAKLNASGNMSLFKIGPDGLEEEIGGSGGDASGWPTALAGLSDVKATLTYDDGFVLRGDGSQYEGRQLAHGDLSDIGTNTHEQIDDHIADMSNPHAVTAAQIDAVTVNGNQVINDRKTFSLFPNLPAVIASGDYEAIYKKYVDDAVSFGVTWKKPVLAVDQTTPPALPTIGDRYIVDTPATDAWLGKENDIAEAVASGWFFYIPQQGWAVIDLDTNTGYNYNGSEWVQFYPPVSFTASNGLTLSTNDFQLGGTLSKSTTIDQGAYNLTHNLSGTGDFVIQDAGTDRFTVNDLGNVGIGYSASQSTTQLFVRPSATNFYGIGIQPYSSDTSSSAYLLRIINSAGTSVGGIYPSGYLWLSQTNDQDTYNTITATQTSSTLYTYTPGTGTDESFNNTYEAIKITASSNYSVRAFSIYLKRTGTITNTTAYIYSYLYSDNAGVPGSLLATGQTIYYSRLTEAYAANVRGLSYNMTAGTSYWLVLRRSAAPSGGTIEINRDTNGTNTMAESSNGTTWTTKNGTPWFRLYGRTGPAVYGTSTNSYGVRGTSSTNYGLYGTSTSSYGIYGVSVSSIGVRGSSTDGYGMYGSSTAGVGIYGNSSTSYGIQGASTSGGGIYAASTSGVGLYAVTTTGTNAYFIATPATSNSEHLMARYYRRTSGTAADGIGQLFEYYIETSNGSDNASASMGVTLTNATAATAKSAFIWRTKNGSTTLSERLRLEGNTLTITGDGVATGTLTAEQLTSTDDITLSGDITVTASGVSNIGTVSLAFNDAHINQVYLKADPTSPLQSATKQYVDAVTTSLSGYVPYTGATTGVNLGSNTLSTTGQITTGNIVPTSSGSYDLGTISLAFDDAYIDKVYLEADPTLPLQAATKKYTDSNFLKLDQSSPQTVSGGAPTFSSGIEISSAIKDTRTFNTSFGILTVGDDDETGLKYARTATSDQIYLAIGRDGSSSTGLSVAKNYTTGKITSFIRGDTSLYEGNLTPNASGTYGIGTTAKAFASGVFDKVFLKSDPTVPLQAATKQYVDNAVSGENLWDRTGTILSPHTSGDTVTTTGQVISTYGIGGLETQGTNPSVSLKDNSLSYQGYLAIASAVGAYNALSSPGDVVLRSDDANVIIGTEVGSGGHIKFATNDTLKMQISNNGNIDFQSGDIITGGDVYLNASGIFQNISTKSIQASGNITSTETVESSGVIVKTSLDLTDLNSSVSMFSDYTVGNTTDGNALNIYRNAAEGTTYIKTFVDNSKVGNMIFNGGDSIYTAMNIGSTFGTIEIEYQTDTYLYIRPTTSANTFVIESGGAFVGSTKAPMIVRGGSATNASGGSFTGQGGDALTNNFSGGAATLRGGNGLGSSGAPGSVIITGGTSNSSQNGGNVTIYGGSSVSGTAGKVIITGLVDFDAITGGVDIGSNTITTTSLGTFGGVTSSANILPNASGTIDIGTTALAFDDAHIDKVYLKSDPTLPLQAVTKQYVDAIIPSASGQFLRLDQTEKQTVDGGQPIFASGIALGNDSSNTQEIFRILDGTSESENPIFQWRPNYELSSYGGFSFYSPASSNDVTLPCIGNANVALAAFTTNPDKDSYSVFYDNSTGSIANARYWVMGKYGSDTDESKNRFSLSYIDWANELYGISPYLTMTTRGKTSWFCIASGILWPDEVLDLHEGEIKKSGAGSWIAYKNDVSLTSNCDGPNYLMVLQTDSSDKFKISESGDVYANGVVESSGNLITHNDLDVRGDATFGTNETDLAINLEGSSSNEILWNINGVAAPSFSSRSAGSKLILWPYLSGSTTDYSIGIEAGAMWFDTPTTAGKFYFYGGDSRAVELDGTGNISASGTLLVHTDLDVRGTAEINEVYTPSLNIYQGSNTADKGTITWLNSYRLFNTTGGLNLESSSSSGDYMTFASTTISDISYPLLRPLASDGAKTCILDSNLIVRDGYVAFSTSDAPSVQGLIGYSSYTDSFTLWGDTTVLQSDGQDAGLKLAYGAILGQSAAGASGSIVWSTRRQADSGISGTTWTPFRMRSTINSSNKANYNADMDFSVTSYTGTKTVMTLSSSSGVYVPDLSIGSDGINAASSGTIDIGSVSSPFKTVYTDSAVVGLNDILPSASGSSDVGSSLKPFNEGHFNSIIADSVTANSIAGITYQPYNLVYNNLFTSWEDGASADPTMWVSASDAGTATIAQEASIVKIGTYSAKLTTDGTNDANLQQGIFNFGMRSQTITLKAAVYCAEASRARISIIDYGGATEQTYSSYHTGGGDWEYLTVTKIIQGDSTAINIGLFLESGGALDAYLDDVTCVIGSTVTGTPVAVPSIKRITKGLGDAVLFDPDDGNGYATIAISIVDHQSTLFPNYSTSLTGADRHYYIAYSFKIPDNFVSFAYGKCVQVPYNCSSSDIQTSIILVDSTNTPFNVVGPYSIQDSFQNIYVTGTQMSTGTFTPGGYVHIVLNPTHTSASTYIAHIGEPTISYIGT